MLTTSYQNKAWNNEAQETTSTKKTSHIQSASEKGKEYEKIVMNHWFAHMLRLIISFSNIPPLVALAFSPTSFQIGLNSAEPMVDPYEPKNK